MSIIVGEHNSHNEHDNFSEHSTGPQPASLPEESCSCHRPGHLRPNALFNVKHSSFFCHDKSGPWSMAHSSRMTDFGKYLMSVSVPKFSELLLSIVKMALNKLSELTLLTTVKDAPIAGQTGHNNQGDHIPTVAPKHQPSHSSGGCACSSCAGTADTGPWIKWFKALAIRLGLIVVIYSLIYTLQKYEIWEPCQYKISYHRECKIDTYVYEILSYTTYKEDFFCIVPGITFHQIEAGWNLDRKCT